MATQRIGQCLAWMAVLIPGTLIPATVCAQVVPGSGQKLTAVGDDFEDEKWAYTFNNPKSSDEIDQQKRFPTSYSTNGRWFEGIMRGHPDVLKRVPTPDGGLPGSQGALLMVSRQTGIPGNYSHKLQQDDLIVNVNSRLRGAIPVSRTPSVVVRVFLPPWEEWERRRGPSFGFRAACLTHKTETKKGFGRFGGSSKVTKSETYWPGLFIQFHPGDGDKKPDGAALVVRSGPNGGDFIGPAIKETGWWTLGMSFTADGAVHYYARPGIEELSSADRVSSQYPYGYRCEYVDTFFFNVCSNDDGKWSTPWIIDDPSLYVAGQYARR